MGGKKEIYQYISIVTTNSPTPSFLQANEQCQSTEGGKVSHSMDLLNRGSSILGLITRGFSLPWDRDAKHPLSAWPHLFHGAGHEKRKRRGEQLKWSLAFRLYIGSFPRVQLPGPVYTAWLGQVFFLCVFSL